MLRTTAINEWTLWTHCQHYQWSIKLMFIYIYSFYSMNIYEFTYMYPTSGHPLLWPLHQPLSAFRQEDTQQNAPDRDAVEKSLIHVGTQADDKHRNPPTLEVRVRKTVPRIRKNFSQPSGILRIIISYNSFIFLYVCIYVYMYICICIYIYLSLSFSMLVIS